MAGTVGTHPVSYCQESLLGETESAVNVPAVVELSGPVDHDRVRQLLDTLAARHGALRTIFTAAEGAAIPTQTVLDRASISVSHHHHFGHVRDLVPQWLLAGSERPFRLVGQLLARADLHEVADRAVLVLWLHHTISDLVTSQILSDEIARLWRGEELPTPVVHLADFARQERAVRPTPAQWRYWERALAGVDDRLGQPFPDRTAHVMTRPALPVLPADVVTSLHELARGGRTTLTAVLAAAVIAAHYPAASADRVVIGLTVSNRDQPHLRTVVGCLADQLPLVVDIGGNLTFRELLGRVREALFDAYDHRVPLGRLLPLLPRGYAPVFAVNLNFLPPPARPPRSGPPPSDLSVPYGIAKSRPDGWWLGDATLAYRPRIDDGRLAGEVEGDGYLHADGEVRRYAERFSQLLGRVAESPDVTVSTL
jgi:hypothetical protein